MKCDVGQYMNKEGAVNCLACNPGDFQNKTGAEFCRNCVKSTFTNSSGMSSCYACRVGEKAEQGSVKCTKCEAGEAGTGDGGTCEKCAAGQSRKSTDETTTSCTPCKRGEYQEQKGQTTCYKCILGQHQPEQGSTECSTCKAGQYQNNPGEKDCIVLDSGNIVVGGGSTTVNVPVGSFKTNCTGAIEGSCKAFEQCPAGWVGNSPANMNCTACIRGQTSASGSPQGGCRTCAKGKFGETKGQKDCSLCPNSWYQPQDLNPSTECTACPVGYTQGQMGESSCVDPGGIKPENCGDDEYWVPDKFPDKDEKSQAGCVDCPAGGSCTGAIGKQGIRALFGWSKCPNLNLTYSQCKFGAACNGAINEILIGKYIDAESENFDPAMNDQNESCSVAYKSNSFLCSACADAFSHSGLGDKCDACPSSAENNGIAAAGVVVGIAGLFIYVLITLSDEGKIDPADGAKSIGLSYIQIISLLTTFPIAWPDIFISIFRIGGAVGECWCC